MKQQIGRYTNNNILTINNYNNIGRYHGLRIGYFSNGSIWCIRNQFNGKLFGLYTLKYDNGEIEQSYYL